MKLFKRITGLALASALIMTTSMSIFAADETAIDTSGGTGTVSLTYTANTTAFNVSIPTTIQLSDSEVTDVPITSTVMNLLPTESVVVKVSAGHTDGVVTLNRVSGTPDSITTTLKINDTAITNSTEIAKFVDSATPTTNTIAMLKASPVTKTASTLAGDYVSSGLTFTVTKFK